MTFLLQNTSTLFWVGGGLTVLSALFGLLIARNRRYWTRIPVILLALAGWLLLAGSLIGSVVRGQYGLIGLLMIAGILILAVGLLELSIEVRVKAIQKPGGLIMGIGLFVLVGSLFIPILPDQLTPTPYQSPTAMLPTPTRTLPATRTPVMTHTPTLPPSTTPTATDLPTLTFTPLVTSVPPNSTLPSVPEATVQPDAGSLTAITPTAAVTTSLVTCTLTPFRNVNLRAQPDSSSILLATIPFGTALTAIAQNATWWQVNNDGQTGWIVKEFVNAAASCTKLPVQSP